MKIEFVFLLAVFTMAGSAASVSRFPPSDAGSHQQDPHLISPGLKWTMTFRGRYENKRNFRFGSGAPGDSDAYYLIRFRPGIQWDPNPEWSVAVEGQVAHIEGSNAINAKATPNAFEDELDLNLASAEYKGNAVNAKIGRQKLNYGNQRLLGSLEWTNAARVFDAALLTLGETAKTSLTLFAAKPIAANPRDWNDWHQTGNRYYDSALYGTWMNLPQYNRNGSFSAHYFLRNNNLNDDRVNTVGFIVSHSLGRLTYDGEFNYQFGTFGGNKHRANAGHIGVTYKSADEHKTTLNAMYNWASGDKNAQDGTHETFDNLYPTNHIHYGEMDYFAWMNVSNIEIGITQTYDKLVARAAFHWFWLDKAADSWYQANGSAFAPPKPAADRFVGNELDLILRYNYTDAFAWTFGFSTFYKGDYFKGVAAQRPPSALYFMLNWKL